MHHALIQDIGLAIIISGVIGFLTHKLNQPIILGYLIAGIIVGPEIGPQLVVDPTNIETISELGLILLLFIIGLEMNPQKLLSSGKTILGAGIGQFPLTVLTGAFFFYLIGYKINSADMSALYLGIFCALSSTAIVVKMLYDKMELDTIAGRITLGVLIFQDIWAIFVLAFQPDFHNPDPQKLFFTLIQAIGLILFCLFFSKYILARIFAAITKNPEMVVALSIGWLSLVAFLASIAGLSKEMGALIAGITISFFPYSIFVTAKVLPLRDFFLTLFFVSIGMKIPVPEYSIMIQVPAVIGFTILSRFLIITPILKSLGSGRRTYFFTSLNLAQISEFSLVIAALGITHNHISKDLMSVILYSMAITSILSSYIIKYADFLFNLFNRALTKVVGKERGNRERKNNGEAAIENGIYILGFHRGARAFIDSIRAAKSDLANKITVIDFNIEVLKELKSSGIHTIFGDIGSFETLHHSGIENAKIILSTIPDMLLKGTTNIKLVQKCRSLAPNATIYATADFKDQNELLKIAGANIVILPYSLAGDYIADLILATEAKELKTEAARNK